MAGTLQGSCSVSGYLKASGNRASKTPLRKAEINWVINIILRRNAAASLRQIPSRFREAHLAAAHPKWKFSDATVRSQWAASFDNPDHVAVAPCRYQIIFTDGRARLGRRRVKYDDLRKATSLKSSIPVPTSTRRRCQRAPTPRGSYAPGKFSGKLSTAKPSREEVGPTICLRKLPQICASRD